MESAEESGESEGEFTEPTEKPELPKKDNWLNRLWRWLRSWFGLKCEGSVCVEKGKCGVYNIQQGSKVVKVFGKRIYFVFKNINECCVKFLYSQNLGWRIEVIKIVGGVERLDYPTQGPPEPDLEPDPGIASDPRISNPDGIFPQQNDRISDTPGVDLLTEPLHPTNYNYKYAIRLRAFIKDRCHGMKEVDHVQCRLSFYVVVRNDKVIHTRSKCRFELESGKVC
ncbi:hypothetical protein HY386_01665 [Candidatus Daviesbacteria bacterium]|nr:hypothetical protein [Candidatus Daviesbacteria bacterium]